MSGIVGVWNLDGRPVDEDVIAAMARTLAHRGLDGEGRWTNGSVGLACQLARVVPEAAGEAQPLVDAAGAVVVFDGRLDNREELLGVVGGQRGITAQAPDPVLVLAAYHRFGEPFAERLAGDFALGLFDPWQRRLVLVRDAIGVRPLYFCRASRAFLFASEIKAIFAHPEVSRRPNDDVLADSFLLHRLQDRGGMTFFADVLSLPPAHMTVLDRGGFRMRRYWDFNPGQRLILGSFPEYAEAFRHHFETAVARRLRSAHPVGVSVSGGLDSSAIFCTAETLRRRAPARFPVAVGASYTFADGLPSDEKAFLGEIERAYGVQIERVPIGPPGLLDGAKEAVWHIEAPLLDAQWNGTPSFSRAIRDQGVRVLLTGHWGDQVLFDQAYLVDLFRCLRWVEVRAHLAEYARWLTDAEPQSFRRRFARDLVKHHSPGGMIPLLRRVHARLFPSTLPRSCYTGSFRRRARQRRPDGLTMWARSATAHARSLYEEARSPSHVLSLEWNNKVAAMHGLEMAFPFLDRDLVQFLMTIPGEIQAWRGTPKILLRTALGGVIPDAIATRRWKADFTAVVNDGAVRDYPYIAHHLLAGGVAIRRGYVKPHGLREELERLRRRIDGSSCEAAWALRDLLGLEMWLQVFFEEANYGRYCPEGRASSKVGGA